MNNIEILEDYKKIMEDLYRFIDDDMGGHFESVVGNQKANTMLGYLVFERKLENLIQENKELKEYKKIAELTKISCCTAQNCEALNNAIKNGLENEKLLQENKELKEKREEYEKQLDLDYVEENYIPKSKLKEKIEDLEKQAEEVKNHYKGTYACLDEYLNAKSKIQGFKELLEEGE